MELMTDVAERHRLQDEMDEKAAAVRRQLRAVQNAARKDLGLAPMIPSERR